MIAPLVEDNVIIVSAQNEYCNYEAVAYIVGKAHTLLARIIFGVRIIKTGYSEVTVIEDDVGMGQPEDAIPEDAIIKIASEVNKAGVPTSYAVDVNEILWDKMLYNFALNPLGALLKCNYGGLAGHEKTKRVMDALIKEIFQVAQSNSIKLHWEGAESYIDYFYKKLVPPSQEPYPSMYHDLKAGKGLEIDALKGAFVRLAAEKGVPVPVNETILDLITVKEKSYHDKRPFSMAL